MIHEDDKFVIHGPPPLKPLPDLSLGKLIYDSLVANPNKHEAMVDAASGESITYRKILEKSCCLAESLQRNGYERNTVVAIGSENNLQYFIPVISCLYIGAIVAPINPSYTEHEMIHSLEISQPRLIFCSKTASQKFVSLKDTKLTFIEKIIVIDSDDAIDGTEPMDQFIQKSLEGGALLDQFPVSKLDAAKQIAFIMCSSGTAGLPKCVMQTHTNVMVRYMHTIDPRYVKPFDNFLGILPFFHGYGLVTTLIALVLGQKVVVMKRFQEELFLETIQNYKINSLWIAPPLAVFLAKNPLVEKYDLSCVEEVASAAAPLSKETEEALKKRLKINGIRQGYGLTEAISGVTMMHVGDVKHGSVGKVVTYMSVKIRDPVTGKSLGPGEVGEIAVKGPMVMPGYYKNEEATKNTFTSDGWLLTGDLGYYDEEQYFYIVDRLKELIKYKGFQVPPAELEAILLNHPKVADVGVVGLPDDEAGELPVAFVVKKDTDLTEEEVVNFVADKVSSQKQLRGGVIFVSTIPKNPSGKVLRRELRKMLTSQRKSNS